MRDYLKAIKPGREKAAPMFEGILKILTADELITQRAEKALTYLLDFDLDGDPNGETWKLWASLMSDVNQTVVGPEELDPRWAEAIIQKILKLLWLTHEVSSPAHLIEVTNTKTTKATVIQSVALPRKPTPERRFRAG